MNLHISSNFSTKFNQIDKKANKVIRFFHLHLSTSPFKNGAQSISKIQLIKLGKFSNSQNSTKAELSSPSRAIEDGDILSSPSSSSSPPKRVEFELLFHGATSSRRVLDKSELMKAVRIHGPIQRRWT